MQKVSQRAASLALVMVIFMVAAYFFWPKSPPPNPVEPVEPVVPVTVAPAPAPPPISPVVAIPDPTPTKPPKLPGAVGVMVENSFRSRPQAGLDKADLIYELEAEYGITRFLALFHTEEAQKVGPVRSARTGFYEVAIAYGIPYAHAGGNNDVLIALKAGGHGLLDLDDIYTCGSCFWRSADREMPHNLYTNTSLLTNRAKESGYGLRPLHTFPVGPVPAGSKAATDIAFNWGAESLRVGWLWDGNRYKRSVEDTPHLLEGGIQIAADNLVVIFTTYRWNPIPQWGEGQNEISIVGSGPGYLFRNGSAFPVAWSKNSQNQHYKLTNPDGSEIHFAPGQTWFHVLKDKGHLTKGAPE